MATPKKKHLIELMIEAGVKWPEGAEYAAQDKYNLCVRFYEKGKPLRSSGMNYWDSIGGSLIREMMVKLPKLCSDWHQSIVTREQYEKALADASVTPTAQPAQEYCASVMRQMPDNTIEQLTADYHAKAAEADRLQAVADDALKAADDALLALEKAGELLGLVISIDTKPKQVGQLNITDLRDLRVGDVIFIGESLAPFTAPSGEYKVVGVDVESETQPAAVEWGDGEVWPLLAERGWRFIRRP